MENQKKPLLTTEEDVLQTSKKMSSTTWSNATKAGITLAVAMAIGGVTAQEANSQTLVNNKQNNRIVENAEKSIGVVGEQVAMYVYNGGMQREIQLKMENQNSNHGQKYEDREFSIFKDENVKNENVQDEDSEKIKTQEEIKEKILRDIDSLVTKDLSVYYNAFHDFQESGVGLVGHKKWKEESGFNLTAFPENINIDFLVNNKNIPYNKQDQVLLKATSEKIWEEELIKWKTQAAKNRASMNPAEYESADLLALEATRQKIVDRLWKEVIKPEMDKAIKQYYSTTKLTTGKTVKDATKHVRNY